MIKFFKRLFSKSKPKLSSLFYIDGDNGINKATLTSICKQDIGWTYIWVQNKLAFHAKYLATLPLEIVNPSNIGKESTDTFIAMDIVHRCASGLVKQVVIHSGDMDFLDVCVNAAKMFPHVDFCLMSNRTGASIKTVGMRNLPSNVRRITFRPKIATKSTKLRQ